MIHRCNCGKKFHRIGAYRRHRGICEILREKSNIQKKELEEISDIPPLDEIWVIIKILVHENNKLKKELKKIKTHVNIQNKRIDILNWLNTNKRPETTYEDLFNEIEIHESELSKIFEMGFLNGMLDILENNIDNTIIKAYNQKTNKLYIYSNFKWKLLEIYEFKTIIKKIQNELLKHFMNWSNENQTIVNNYQSDEYIIKSKELIGGKKIFSKTIKPLYNRLYKILKIDLKDELLIKQ